MSKSEFQNVSRVIELRLSTDEVNEYLGKGWILLNTFVESAPSDDGTSQRAVRSRLEGDGQPVRAGDS